MEVRTRGKTSIWYLSRTSLSLHTHEAPIGFWFLINIGYPCTLTSASVTISMVERQQCPIHCLTKTERSSVTTCASESGSGMWRNPTGDDRVSSAHKRRRGVKGVSSTTALAHWFPPPSSSGG